MAEEENNIFHELNEEDSTILISKKLLPPELITEKQVKKYLASLELRQKKNDGEKAK